MAAGEIHKGDIGTILRLTLYDGESVADVSTATTKQIKLYKPSGTTVTKTASFYTDGSDGIVQYTTTSVDDLNEVGSWQIQGYVVAPGFTNNSDIHQFEVYDNLG